MCCWPCTKLRNLFFRVYMVSEEEWVQIKNFFTVDKEIVVTRNKNGDGDNLLSSQPDVCQDCVRERHEQEEKVCPFICQGILSVAYKMQKMPFKMQKFCIQSEGKVSQALLPSFGKLKICIVNAVSSALTPSSFGLKCRKFVF